MRKAGIVPAAIAALCLSFGTFAVAQESQPHMRAALQALQQAKAELERAEHDKGGHREQALKEVNEAIRQVQAGVSYDNHHESKKERDKDKDRDRDRQ